MRAGLSELITTFSARAINWSKILDEKTKYFIPKKSGAKPCPIREAWFLRAGFLSIG
jgi:hypothetical protein